MNNWLKRNYKTIIRVSYIIPILVAAGISIYHVISWYNITNPIGWAIYLSIGIEIAALSALAGMTAKMNKWVYLPFFIVTFIQIIGNIFSSYQYIDVNGEMFKSWVELFNPIFESFGWVENGDVMMHKRILGILGGIFIPLISLSFLHLLISFNEKESNVEENNSDSKNKGPKIVTNKIDDSIKGIDAEAELIKILEEEMAKTPLKYNVDTDIEPKKEEIIDIEPKKEEIIDIESKKEEIIDIEPKKEEKNQLIIKKRDPVIPTGEVTRDEIAEIKNSDTRKFSVKIPNSNNSISKIN